MASLENIRVEFVQQSRDRFAGSLRVGVLANSAYHPSALDSFPQRPFVGPTELPDIWIALATTPDQTPLLHFRLRHRSCDAEEFLRKGCKTETRETGRMHCFAAATWFRQIDQGAVITSGLVDNMPKDSEI